MSIAYGYPSDRKSQFAAPSSHQGDDPASGRFTIEFLDLVLNVGFPYGRDEELILRYTHFPGYGYEMKMYASSCKNQFLAIHPQPFLRPASGQFILVIENQALDFPFGRIIGSAYPHITFSIDPQRYHPRPTAIYDGVRDRLYVAFRFHYLEIMMALCAIRLGLKNDAVDLLLTHTPKNTWTVNGHNRAGKDLPAYLPTNGTLLWAAALMATEKCYPDDGSWIVTSERIAAPFDNVD